MSRNPPTETGKRVREIFTAALACPDLSSRRRLLDSECGTSGQLREQVEALLEESSRVGSFLEEPAVSETRADGSARRSISDLPPGEHPGDRIGPYKLIDLLGEGGGGSVYRAEQSDPMERTVALKILKLGMDTKSVIARFEAERQSLAMMDHPNIARVLDAGATAEGRPYFVMDFVPGEPITDYCDASTLTIDQRVALFIKVCRGVEHAHQKGVIHRDLKPSNILVATVDGEATPKIIDFGVAKAIDPLSSATSAVTRMETIIGTPAYMSPEQAERDSLDIDTRCDVYSLGTLLHELLTGFTPLDSRQVANAGIEELRRSFRELVPTRPSARLQSAPAAERPRIEFDRSASIAQLSTQLRGELDWIVLKCLETDRTRRFGSANDLARDLERYLAGEPVTARPPSTAYRVRKFVRRHRVAVVASCLLFLMLISAVAVSTALAIRATQAERDMRDAHRVQSELRSDAVRDREEALRSAATARRNEYVADINVSHRALSDGNIAKALQLLDRHTSSDADLEDLRGFEWRYLAGRCLGDEHRSLPRQDSAIESLTFSADGRRLAICSRDQLLVWDFATDQPLAVLPGGVSSAVFFPDGRRLAATSRGGVWIHDLESAAPVMELTDEGGAMSLSPDGQLLAATGRRGVTIWDTANWSRWHQLPQCLGPLAFSPNSETLATGTRDGITLWSMTTLGEQLVLANSPGVFRGGFPGGASNVFSHDGRYFVAALNLKANRDGYFLGIWDTESGEQVSTLPGNRGDGGHAGIVSAASFDAAGTQLATSSWDHSVRLWDFASRRVTHTLHGHRGEVWSVALSPDGRVVASGSKNGEVKIWPTVQVSPSEGIDGRWKPLNYSADSNYIAAQNREGTISIFNLTSHEEVHSIQLSSTGSRFRGQAVSLGRDLTALAEGMPDGSVTLKRLDDKSEESFPVSERRVDFVALSPAADTLVTVGWRDDLAWWDLADTTTPIVRISGSHALFSPDGTTLATANREGYIVIWDTATRSERARITHQAQASGSSLALSPDGGVLAMSHGFDDFENAISLWDTTSGKQLGTLAGHKQGIWSIAFSPDGKTLASSSGGGTLRFWNIASQRELLTIREPGTNLINLQFSPDGQYLVGGTPNFSSAGKLRIIHAPPIDFAEARGELQP